MSWLSFIFNLDIYLASEHIYLEVEIFIFNLDRYLASENVYLEVEIFIFNLDRYLASENFYLEAEMQVGYPSYSIWTDIWLVRIFT